MEKTETVAVVCPHIIENNQPVLLVGHQGVNLCFLCGEEHSEEETPKSITVEELIQRDSSLEEVLDLESTCFAKRSSAEEPWVIEPKTKNDAEKERLKDLFINLSVGQQIHFLSFLIFYLTMCRRGDYHSEESRGYKATNEIIHRISTQMIKLTGSGPGGYPDDVIIDIIFSTAHYGGVDLENEVIYSFQQALLKCPPEPQTK